MSNNYNYDLEDRTEEFSKRVIRLCKFLDKNIINIPLINQILRSATSVGANYKEACNATSTKDFIYRIRICLKESKETHYWIKLIIESNPSLKPRLNNLLDEALQLVKIFSASVSKSLKNKDKNN